MLSRLNHQLWIILMILALALPGTWAMAQEKSVRGAELIKDLENQVAGLEAGKTAAITDFDVILVEKRKTDKIESEQKKKKLEEDDKKISKDFNSKIKNLLNKHKKSIVGGVIKCKDSVCKGEFDRLKTSINKYKSSYKKTLKELNEKISPPPLNAKIKAAELKSMTEFFDAQIKALKQKIAFERTRLAYANGKGDRKKALKIMACTTKRCADLSGDEDAHYACVRCCWNEGCNNVSLGVKHVRSKKQLTPEQVIERYKASGSARPGPKTFKSKEVPSPAP